MNGPFVVIVLVYDRAMRRVKTGFIMAHLLLVYVALAALKHLVPLPQLVRWAWHPSAALRNPEAERRLAAKVLRLSQLTGLPDRDCLQRSLLLYRMLSRLGADPTLVVGFQQTNGRVLGHAWVTVDGHPIFESDGNLIGFSPILRFGVRGELLPDPIE